MRVIEDIVYGKEKNNLLDIYLSEKKNAPVFVFFHGGGLEYGSYKFENLEKNIMQELAQKGITAVSAEYRMYPEAKFPDFLNDAANAVLWVKNNLSKYTDYSGIFVGGSSAGGYISQMLCFDKRYLENVGMSLEQISGFVHDSGQPTTHFNVLNERGYGKKEGGGDTRRVHIDDAAPMYYVDGTQKYPPMKFIVADNDMPNRRIQTELLLEVLKNYDYDMSRIEFRIMENCTHTSYHNVCDANGENLFVKEVYEFIDKIQNNKA